MKIETIRYIKMRGKRGIYRERWEKREKERKKKRGGEQMEKNEKK